MKRNRRIYFVVTMLLIAVFLLSGCQMEEQEPMEIRGSNNENVKDYVSDGLSIDKKFEYRTDGRVKRVYLYLEELRDGVLTELSGAGGQAAESGTLGFSFDKEEWEVFWEGGSYRMDNVEDPELSAIYKVLGESEVPIVYNQKLPFAMIIFGRGAEAETIEMAAGYHDLMNYIDSDYQRVLLLTAVFTDFVPEEELVSYNWIVRDKAVLSKDTISWLENYQKMKLMDQLLFSSAPTEFLDVTEGCVAVETAAEK